MDDQDETVKFKQTVMLQITARLDGEFVVGADGYLKETKLGPASPSDAPRIQKMCVYQGTQVPDELMEKVNAFSVYKALQEAIRFIERTLPDAPMREEEVLMDSNGSRIPEDKIN